ncbi:serpentine type 7TM GPCR chemoreceptor srt domain-containing protein [Ditylenchus destructor]|nr:serpentine type 7TM GPCR chemoreceptor srt domain-containing protein [Ditylenchus destructor]
MSSYFYDCAKYNVDTIPIEERQHISVGILFVTIGVLCQMLYIPCLYAIYQQIKLNRFATCYKFMFYLGIVDIVGLMITGVICGVASIQGLVYCQQPLFSYTFLQVLVTSTFVVSTSLGFIYQEHLKSFPIFVFVGYILYQGSPAFIYLCMNQSIRNTLLSKSSKIYQSSNLAPSNVPPTRDQNVSRNDTAT